MFRTLWITSYIIVCLLLETTIFTTPKIDQKFGRKMYPSDKGKQSFEKTCNTMTCIKLQKGLKYLK